MNIKKGKLIFWIAAAVILQSTVFAWDKVNHANITRAAFEQLTRKGQRMFGSAADSMIEHYSLNPDYHRAAVRQKNQARIDFYEPYVALPLLQNIKQWHKNDDDNSEVCFYITTKLMHHAVLNLQKGEPLEAAKYLGSLAHFIEDNACPVHVLPDKTIAQLLISPDYPQPMNIHRAVDRAVFTVNISGYKPQLLGKNLVEASEAIFFRFKDNRINARAQIVPLVQSMFTKDEVGVAKYGAVAAEPTARLFADILHTVCTLTEEGR